MRSIVSARSTIVWFGLVRKRRRTGVAMWVDCCSCPLFWQTQVGFPQVVTREPWFRAGYLAVDYRNACTLRSLGACWHPVLVVAPCGTVYKTVVWFWFAKGDAWVGVVWMVALLRVHLFDRRPVLFAKGL